jgi:hypothetical protein
MDAYGERRICENCVGDEYLGKQIELNGDVACCAYCTEDEWQTWPLSEVSAAVETAFEQHFQRTSDQPDGYQSMMLRDKELSYEWDRDGEPTIYAIMNSMDCSEDVAADIQQYLEKENADWDAAKCGEECAFDAEAHYEEVMPSDGSWHSEWFRFERRLQQEIRFFDSEAQTYLRSIFAGVDQMRTSSGNPVIVTGGPEMNISGFYRGRVFYSDKKLETAMKRPDLELAPPPAEFASAGRMNAHGVSVFYGADSSLGAIAEVRPPVASQVLIGRFNLLRQVHLLDVQALEKIVEQGSIFDPGYADRLSRASFLRSLKHRISRPVMPTDEALEYLATQAVIDFLANAFDMPLDGVLFPSAQMDASINVVLFHQSSKVRNLELPEGTELDASTYMATDEGHDPWFTVYERVPTVDEAAAAAKAVSKSAGPFAHFDDKPYEFDERVETLEVDLSDLEVHAVSEIKHITVSHEVTRHRMEKSDYEPF